MTRLVPRDALDDGTTRSRRGRRDHARRVRPDRAPARLASRVSRRHLTRRSAKSMGWNPKNPMVRGCGRGHGRSTAAVLTDFLSALSHPVESNAKGNARRPLATPSVPVEEGNGARRSRNIEKLGSRLRQKNASDQVLRPDKTNKLGLGARGFLSSKLSTEGTERATPTPAIERARTAERP